MTHPEPPSDDLMRERRLQRNLKIVVGGLGALILFGLGAVAVKVVGLATGPNGGALTSRSAGTGSAAAKVLFELPKGARIVSISLSGDRLAVQHDGPSGPGIVILDAVTGRRIVDMKPVEALPSN
ncbi:MAG: hypothetical protein QM780_09395 [Hyphomicrobium sp.]|uniref:hypothetical protein n=1 Tax=Hyphomicrobium sp. TaxID=82 RepID=UPI0039E2B40C